MKDYDKWHKDHLDESEIDTIWYRFVQNSIHLETDINKKRILEIGCGRGGFAYYLARISSDETTIVGSDYSTFVLDHAKQKFLSNKIEWRNEDIQKLTFQNIEHVPYPKKAINELYRVLKPGGRLFLTCPNYFNFFGIWCFYRFMIGKPFTEGGQPYVNYILMPFVYFELVKAGFRIEKCYSADLILPLRRPKHFSFDRTPKWLTFFGFRSFYILRKSYGHN
jgi:SAM-dependent methyltransferase